MEIAIFTIKKKSPSQKTINKDEMKRNKKAVHFGRLSKKYVNKS